MTQPTVWEVPAITAGTPQVRVFSRAFPRSNFPWRKHLEIYNHSSATLATVLVNGSVEVVVAPGDSRVVDWVPEIRSYSIDANANTALGDIEVTESGGLDAQ